MSSTTITNATTFVAPGKGEWISLRDHFPRAVTAEYARILPMAMAEGEAIPFAEYGMPMKTLTIRLVHGHVYAAPEPLVGPASDRVPPKAALWLATRLVPAFRRRTRAARRALADRPWLADAERWYATERQWWTDANAALQAEDPDGLAPDALVDHLERVVDHATAGYRRHFSLHGPDLMPTGLLLARCDDWGVATEDVLSLLVGSSPASLGSGPSLGALRQAVRASGREVTTIDEVRSAAPMELDAFLAEHGWRLVTGYDLDSLALIELPALVVQLARAGAEPVGVDSTSIRRRRDEDLGRLRAIVPADEVDELERLVGDAWATFGMRDDNGGLTGAWPMGLLRRAMLAAGRQLAARGALEIPEHALELTVDELVALLLARPGPTPDDIARRAAERVARSALVPPLHLGPTADIPLDALPAAMRTVSRAQLRLRDTFTVPPEARAVLTGDGVGGAAYQGRACVAVEPGEALARLEPGDVLVALGTTPAFNMALSIAGAVVVEEGGLLSHAAVIARELGLPAVIGAAGAMEAIPDGALVEVDPVAGRVRVLAPG
jgi:phosphohistidine swiveling domain-containing protein